MIPALISVAMASLAIVFALSLALRGLNPRRERRATTPRR